MHLLIRSLFILPYCPLVLSVIVYICNKNYNNAAGPPDFFSCTACAQRYWHWHRHSHALIYFRKISSYWLWIRILNSNNANYYVFATENREWSLSRSCAGRHGVKYQQSGADRRIELFVFDVKAVFQMNGWVNGLTLYNVHVMFEISAKTIYIKEIIV
jgi:hypothetical protein